MTLIQMVRQVQLSMPGLSTAAVRSALNRAYADLALSWEWADLETEIPATYQPPVDETLAEAGELVAGDNKVTVTNGSIDVYMNIGTTSQSANGWTAAATYLALINQLAKNRQPPQPLKMNFEDDEYSYNVDTVTYHPVPTTHATFSVRLTTPYLGSTGTVTKFSLFQERIRLNNTPAVRQILAVTSETDLDEVTRADLDRLDPKRERTSTYPSVWCKAGISSTGEQILEIWPLPADTTVVKVRARTEPLELTSDSMSPRIHPQLIILDAQIQLFSAYMARDPDKANKLFNAFGTWRTARSELYNSIVQEDITRHSTSKKVRNVTDSGAGRRDSYSASDITITYP
jgi:hypothetical protein